jgi:hypothetical protein
MGDDILTISAPAPLFKEFFALPSAMHPDGVLTAHADAVDLDVRDASGSAMVHSRLDAKRFLAYACADPGAKFGLPLSKMDDFLKAAARMDKKSPVLLTVGDDSRVTLRCGRLQFRFSLLGDQSPPQRFDPTKYPYLATALVHVNELRQFVDTCLALTDAACLLFRVENGRLRIEMKDEVNAASIDATEVRLRPGPEGKVPRTYLQGKALKYVTDSLPDRQLLLTLGEDLPLCVTANDDGLLAEAFLAPMVGDD